MVEGMLMFPRAWSDAIELLRANKPQMAIDLIEIDQNLPPDAEIALEISFYIWRGLSHINGLRRRKKMARPTILKIQHEAILKDAFSHNSTDADLSNLAQYLEQLTYWFKEVTPQKITQLERIKWRARSHYALVKGVCKRDKTLPDWRQEAIKLVQDDIRRKFPDLVAQKGDSGTEPYPSFDTVERWLYRKK